MQSPIPILVMVVLAIMSVAKNLVPQALPPVGILLAILGIVFLALYLVGWVREIVTLIAGGLMLGFGVAHWLGELYPVWLAALSLLGLGLGFFVIYVVGAAHDLFEQHGKHWPTLPGLFLVIVGLILGLESQFGREQVWNAVLPLIPVVFALWMVYVYRQIAGLQRPG